MKVKQFTNDQLWFARAYIGSGDKRIGDIITQIMENQNAIIGWIHESHPIKGRSLDFTLNRQE